METLTDAISSFGSFGGRGISEYLRVRVLVGNFGKLLSLQCLRSEKAETISFWRVLKSPKAAVL